MRLRSLAQNNRLSHALLFLGKEGSGALPLANAFAQYLVCEKASVRKERQAKAVAPSLFGEELSPADEDADMLREDSCGQCPSCLKASGSMHPDIHYSYPVVALAKGDKPPISADYASEWRSFISQYPYANAYDWLQSIGAENRQGNITARECSEIIHKLSFKSFESGFKILIMWMPEYLGDQGNKLLKLIEEPPDDTLFFFVAEQEAKILPTILSRTQLVRIPPIAPEAMVEAIVVSTMILICPEAIPSMRGPIRCRITRKWVCLRSRFRPRSCPRIRIPSTRKQTSITARKPICR